MRSKLQHAKAFQRWVLKDVLPTIRRTGNYTQPAKEPEPAITDAQKWDTRRALLEALKSSHTLAQIAGIQLGDGHRKAMENAINEVLLPPGQQQEHMIDAAEMLKRKGHSPAQIARLASELGKALKTACDATGPGSTMNRHEFRNLGRRRANVSRTRGRDPPRRCLLQLPTKGPLPPRLPGSRERSDDDG